VFLLAENTRRKAGFSPPEYCLDARDVNDVDADAEDGHDQILILKAYYKSNFNSARKNRVIYMTRNDRLHGGQYLVYRRIDQQASPGCRCIAGIVTCLWFVQSDCLVGYLGVFPAAICLAAPLRAPLLERRRTRRVGNASWARGSSNMRQISFRRDNRQC